MVEAETELAQAIDITSAVVRGLRLLSVLTARLARTVWYGRVVED